ncbi:MAG: hypothetical protein KDE14_01510 [Rhodobacteraceae bacterium]|nr:hypothetical protein [Paracoccaceae bacterium]
MGEDSHALALMLGQIDGKLDRHLREYERNEAERENDRRASAVYRKEIRGSLATLQAQTAEIPVLARRLDALDGEAATSLESRVAVLSRAVDQLMKKVALAASIGAGALWILTYALHLFGAELKAFVLRVFRLG